MILAPGFVAGNLFFILLHAWVNRSLRTDPTLRGRLCIGVSDETFGWTVASADTRPGRPFAPLLVTAIAAIVFTIGETALFAGTSDVPHFWYFSGAIAALVLAALPFFAARLFRDALARHIDLTLAQCANRRFAFARPALLAVSRIDAQLDEIHTALGLRRRAGALGRCREILIEHAGATQDAAMEALDAARRAAEDDLSNLKPLAAEIRAGTSLIARVKALPDGTEASRAEIGRIAAAIHSPTLADALESGRWADASLIIENIRPDLDTVAATAGTDAGTPQSVEEAYRVLNVRNDTPLDSIKTILSAYRRIWHPDRARDETERALFTLKMQKLNAAWDLIRTARSPFERTADAPPSNNG